MQDVNWLLARMENPALLEKGDEAHLRELIAAHPAFATPYLLLARRLHDMKHSAFDDLLPVISLRAYDRKKLFHLVHDIPHIQTTITPSPSQELEAEKEEIPVEEVKISFPKSRFAIDFNQVEKDSEETIPSEDKELEEIPFSQIRLREEEEVPAAAEALAGKKDKVEEAEGISERHAELVEAEDNSERHAEPVEAEDNSERHAEPVKAEDNSERHAELVEAEDISDRHAEPVEAEDISDRHVEPVEAEDASERHAEPVEAKDNSGRHAEPVEAEDISERHVEPVEAEDNLDRHAVPAEAEDESGDFFSWLNNLNPAGTEHMVSSGSEYFHEVEAEKLVPELEESSQEIAEPDESMLLIEKFIETQPSITRVKNEFFNPVNQAKASEQETDDLVTETIARILIKQEKFEKAIQTYEKLQLKYPQKNDYFAALILELKEKIK